MKFKVPFHNYLQNIPALQNKKKIQNQQPGEQFIPTGMETTLSYTQQKRNDFKLNAISTFEDKWWNCVQNIE